MTSRPEPPPETGCAAVPVAGGRRREMPVVDDGVALGVAAEARTSSASDGFYCKPVVAFVAALLGALALPASAETAAVDRSRIVLAPTDVPGAVAEVRFHNSRLDRGGDAAVTLALSGLSVAVTAITGRGIQPDTIIVDTPEGYVAVPRSITIPDGTDGVILILPTEGEPIL